MKLLLILLSVMTWTVESKNTVSGQGSWPYDIEVSYNCSYQKGTVRAGDEAVLTLGNLGGITVEKIEVYVKSNQNGGAGVFTVQVNGSTATTKEGSLKDWTGVYDNAAFHPITLIDTSHDGVKNLTVSLKGTENSLHIEKFAITYGPRPAHKVKLMAGWRQYDELTEETGMSGVLLPALNDTANWKFVGWSEQEFWYITNPPVVHAAGSRFYPESDCTLWAVYRYDNTPEMIYVSELKDGVYQYVNRTTNTALTGVPDEKEGTMSYASIGDNDADQYYHVTFTTTCDTAYITHEQTGTPIGYNGTQMASKASPWLVYHNNDETLFYTKANGKNYVLWLSVMNGLNSGYYAGLLKADPGPSTMALRVPNTGNSEPAYTCHPEMPEGTEITNERMNELTNERVVQIGIYTLIIKDGKKYLRLK